MYLAKRLSKFATLSKKVFYKLSRNKVFPSIEAAISDIKDGCSIAIGSFFLCGTPQALINAVRDKGVKNLTLITNTSGKCIKNLVGNANLVVYL